MKERLSDLCRNKVGSKLLYRWLGRFNHQVTSGFHRDNAGDHSFLLLGYEPTAVNSRVFVADYTRMIEDKEISLREYFEGFEDINVARSTYSLESYTTEVRPFPKEHYRLLILNNSKSFDHKTFGVFHRGIIDEKAVGEDRVINSVMLELASLPIEEQVGTQDVLDFVRTDKVY